MSQYVVLIKVVTFYRPNGEGPFDLYAITNSSYPAVGIQTLNDFSPIHLTLCHSIYSANRTDYLLKTLQIKFRDQLSHSFWYHLEPEHVRFIETINANNLTSVIGLIHKAERKPELNSSEVAALLEESLKKAEGALT